MEDDVTGTVNNLHAIYRIPSRAAHVGRALFSVSRILQKLSYGIIANME